MPPARGRSAASLVRRCPVDIVRSSLKRVIPASVMIVDDENFTGLEIDESTGRPSELVDIHRVVDEVAESL
jgi:hypothetical protein